MKFYYNLGLIYVIHDCGLNIMVYFKPGVFMRMMYYSVSDRHNKKKEIQVLLPGVEKYYAQI